MVHGSFDIALVGAGLLVGLLVGLTGVGGGALLTPMLVLVFRVDPLVAVSSDLVVSLAMKPVGAAVHWRRGSVRRDIAGWLALGSVPAAFLGAVLLDALGQDLVQPLLRRALGVVLVASASAMVLRARLSRGHSARGGATAVIRPLPTLAVGVVGGLLVGMTSVGSGSLMVVLVMILYPALGSAELVGTDLMQAVPLVASAAIGHLIFGSVEVTLAAALIAGALPGVYIGARLSSWAPDRLVRPVLMTVLVTSGLKLLQVI